LATELALKGLNILMMNYTEQFRQHQRLQVSVLNATPAAAYLPFQTIESQQLMHDLLANAGGSGSNVQGIFQRVVASTIHTLLYGFRVKDSNDPVLRAVVKLNDEFADFVQVGAHIVDQFPVLNNLPGLLAPWKAKAENHYTTKYELRDKNFKRGLESDAWNISKHLKKTVEKDGLDMPLDELAFELGTMIDAALDGTTDSLIWFVVACITQNQAFITKACEQLDNVVGHDRLPVPNDKPNLPYITAIVEEIFRWRPVGPEGVPHLNREETTYDGYTIPKGSVIVPNVWTISREEALFGPDTDEFVPDRWLEKDGMTLKSLPAPAFGYGRRTCPGRYFARNVIWIVVAQLLWSFDIKAGLSEETGEPIPVDPTACTRGLAMRALPFKARFDPRGPWVREIIARDGDTYGVDHAVMLNEIGAEFDKL
jgi:cytochrome P450